jgi:hypothetical protein
VDGLTRRLAAASLTVRTGGAVPFRVPRLRPCGSWTKVGPNASGKRVKGREFRTPSPSPNPRDVKGLNAVERSGQVPLWAVTPEVTGSSPRFVGRKAIELKGPEPVRPDAVAGL